MKLRLLLSLLIGVAFLEAKVAPVEITTSSYQKVVTTSKGKKVVEWKKVTKAVPGTIIKYVNRVKNNSNKPLEKVVVRNKINPNLLYLPKSAKSSSNIKVKFSVDGKRFKEANKLFVVKDGKRRLATYKEYKAIEWEIAKVNPKQYVNLEFQTKIK